ncbi:MAG: mandelate racemase/muconate lactonizing enzyme family protein [Litorilinea sp.]
MKIVEVHARPVVQVRATPLRDALQTLDQAGHCEVTVRSDSGHTGRGDLYSGRVAKSPHIIAALVNEVFAPAILGQDPFMVRAVRDTLWRLTDYHGTPGLAMHGIAGIDIALWDLSRALEQPVWRLLGAQHSQIPAYAMVGWLNYSIDELQRICALAMEQGFRGVKVKVGTPTLAEDLARIQAVRDVVQDKGLIMVDANQVLSVNEALTRGRAYADAGCYWFEEPIRADDVTGLARLAQSLPIPIATGENNFGKRQFRDLFERGAVDIVQPDLRRAGGVTECLEIGLMADAFNIPYASHGGGVHLHVLAALPNTLFMESGLFPAGSTTRLIDGCYPLPQEPGFGQE